MRPAGRDFFSWLDVVLCFNLGSGFDAQGVCNWEDDRRHFVSTISFIFCSASFFLDQLSTSSFYPLHVSKLDNNLLITTLRTLAD